MNDATQARIDEKAIKHSLQAQGANESLAGAIADAAQSAGLGKMDVNYDAWDGDVNDTVQVNESPVPDDLHDRLTDMGFESMDNYDPDGDNSEHLGVCKYEDTRF